MTRLIDADELKEFLNWTSCKAPYSKKQVLMWIDMARTVDAVPVVHGKWIKGSETKLIKKNPYAVLADCWYCSECENEAYWDTDYGQQKFDYCHNCGARMDEE